MAGLIEAGHKCPSCQKGWLAYRMYEGAVMCDRCGYPNAQQTVFMDVHQGPMQVAIGDFAEVAAQNPELYYKPAPTGNDPVSLRDRFAMSALNGMLSSAEMCDRTKVNKDHWSAVAYEFADAMLRARNGQDQKI